jgi:hypothetical protein
VPASLTQRDTHILPESWKDIKFFQIGLSKVRIRLICRPALKFVAELATFMQKEAGSKRREASAPAFYCCHKREECFDSAGEWCVPNHFCQRCSGARSEIERSQFVPLEYSITYLTFQFGDAVS